MCKYPLKNIDYCYVTDVQKIVILVRKFRNSASTVSVSVRKYGRNKIIYILYIFPGPPPPGGKVYAENGVSGSYMDAVFMVHLESEIRTDLQHNFAKGSLLQFTGFCSL